MTQLLSPRFTLALGVAAALAGATGVAHADGVEIRMASLAPTGSRWEKVLSDGASQVADKTSQRVTIKYYFDASQGDEVDSVRKIKAGQLDGAAVTSVGLAIIEPSIKVLELPMMFTSVEELDYVRGKMWKGFQKKFEKRGYILGEPGDVGWVYFLSAKEVKTLDDLKNQKLWQWADDDVVKEMYSQLGVSGVPLGVPEVEGNLTGGKINACYGPPLAAMTLGWEPPKVKFITSMPMAYSIGSTLIKADALKSVSDDDKKLIRKIEKTIAKKLKAAVRKDNDASLKQLKRKGMKVSETPQAMQDAFATAAQATWKALVGKVYSQADLDEVLKYKAEFEAKKSAK